jgi:hypothetical protein
MGQGREAAPVRKAMLVIVLVAASFLGGAFVNGPGLQWAETRVLRSLGLNNGGEIASVELKPGVGSETNLDELRSAKPGTSIAEGPRAPIPSVLTEDESSQSNNADRASVLQTRPKSNSVGVDTPSSEVRATAPSSMKQPVTVSKALKQQVTPADSNVKQASLSSRPAGPGDAERPDAHAKPDILDTLAALLPSNSESSASSLTSSSPPSPPAATAQKPFLDGSDNWTVLERKMQSLGITRYTIEGQPGDRVVFSCLIPLAGRQAIAQRFEAEGDDMVQAAQSALRRITLWRATQ